MTSYTYSIANDTLNGKVSTADLTTEVLSSCVTKALGSITIGGDVLTIVFKEALGVQCEADMATLVAAHNGVVSQPIETFEMKPLLAEGGLRKTDRGFCFEVPAGTTVTYDYPVTNELQIKGGVMYTENNSIKDQISLEIVDTNFIHAGSWYPAEYAAGIPWSVVTPDGVPLHMYVGNYPVAKNGVSFFDNDAITNTPLNGLTIRTTYKSLGTADVICNIGIVAYTK